jgi:RNA polymerase sigma-70 factor (ECF subfamily)
MPSGDNRKAQLDLGNAKRTPRISCNKPPRFFNIRVMATSEPARPGSDHPAPLFLTTHWSVVLAAGQADTSQAQGALSHLCQTYWFPLYAYVRRRGFAPPDAQDLTQEFFARLLRGQWLAQADRDRGRFRSFLLTAMQHFLANEWHRAQTQKRGGEQVIISLNDDSAESRFRKEPSDTTTPETSFERSWALALLQDVLVRLEQEFAAEGKTEWMEAMRPALTFDQDTVYGDIAGRLGITETAARVAVHRLRKRYRQMIRTEVAGTVGSKEDVDSEMRHLFEVLAKGAA